MFCGLSHRLTYNKCIGTILSCQEGKCRNPKRPINKGKTRKDSQPDSEARLEYQVSTRCEQKPNQRTRLELANCLDFAGQYRI